MLSDANDVYAVVSGKDNTNVVGRSAPFKATKPACPASEELSFTLTVGDSNLKNKNHEEFQIQAKVLGGWNDDNQRTSHQQFQGAHTWMEGLPFTDQCKYSCFVIELLINDAYTSSMIAGGGDSKCIVHAGSLHELMQKPKSEFMTFPVSSTDCFFLQDDNANDPMFIKIRWDENFSCPPGQYMDDNIALLESFNPDSCEVCPANTYATSQGSTSCVSCPDGKRTSGTTASYHNALTDCQDCAAGRYLNKGLGALDATCDVCGDNEYSAKGAGSCLDCPSGRYTKESSYQYDHDDAGSCKVCDAGKYVEDRWWPMTYFDQNSCVTCGQGKYSTGDNRENCTTCPDGKTIDSNYMADHDNQNDCEKCPAGKYGDGGLCYECDANEYSNEGNTYCTGCSTSKYTENNGGNAEHAGSEACEGCPAGKYINDQYIILETISDYFADGCITCATNQYSEGEAWDNCHECPWGKTITNTHHNSHDSESDCTDCPAGKFIYNGWGNGVYTCVSCGNYASTSTEQYYQDETGQNTCKSCYAYSKVANDDKTDCVNCPNGKYWYEGGWSYGQGCYNNRRKLPEEPEPKMDESESQAFGEFVERQMTAAGRRLTSDDECDKFFGGFDVTGGLTEVKFHLELPGGFEYDKVLWKDDDGQLNIPFAAWAYDEGFYDCSLADEPSEPESDDPSAPESDTMLCAEGSYQSVTDCVICPAGKYSTTFGATSATTCVDCAVGKHLADTATNALYHDGADDCHLCAPGKHTDSPGARFCNNCLDGKVALSDGTGCGDCDDGREPNAEGTSCVLCGLGKYANSGTLGACTDCERGEYSTIEGATSCQKCQAGKYGAGEGLNSESAACFNCATGKFSDSAAAVACSSCAEGKVIYDTEDIHDSSDYCMERDSTACATYDCSGNVCADNFMSRIGDEVCDVHGVDFNCPEFDYDEGDCIEDEDSEDVEDEEPCELFDCSGICADSYKPHLGDSFCDSMTPDLNCDQFDFDYGDCKQQDGAADEGEEEWIEWEGSWDIAEDIVEEEAVDCTATCDPVKFEACDSTVLTSGCLESCNAIMLKTYTAYFDVGCEGESISEELTVLELQSSIVLKGLTSAGIPNDQRSMWTRLLQLALASSSSYIEAYNVEIMHVRNFHGVVHGRRGLGAGTVEFGDSSGGSCSVAGNCFSSLNYENDEVCDFVVGGGGRLSITTFDTESCCDNFEINNQVYKERSQLEGFEVDAGTTIQWRSDVSVQKAGFEICVELPPSPIELVVHSEAGQSSCAISSTSPNCFSSLAYQANERCDFTSTAGGTISVKSFNTEHGYDMFTIHGEDYISQSSLESLYVAAGTTMTWTSDGSEQRDGWEVCIETAQETTTAPTPAPTTAPTVVTTSEQTASPTLSPTPAPTVRVTSGQTSSPTSQATPIPPFEEGLDSNSLIIEFRIVTADIGVGAAKFDIESFTNGVFEDLERRTGEADFLESALASLRQEESDANVLVESIAKASVGLLAKPTVTIQTHAGAGGGSGGEEPGGEVGEEDGEGGKSGGANSVLGTAMAPAVGGAAALAMGGALFFVYYGRKKSARERRLEAVELSHQLGDEKVDLDHIFDGVKGVGENPMHGV